MNKIILSLVLFFSVIFSYGQEKMFEKAKKAFEFYEKNDKLSAVKIFEELIVEFPDSEHYGRNLYNIPTIYQEIGEYDLAIKWFLRVLEDKKINDSQLDNSRGIMETNTNFKHNSSYNLGVIYFNKKEYSEALKYYQLADTKYFYYNSSGTDIKLNKMYLASNISDCYLNLKEINNSIVVLIPHVLSKSPGKDLSEKLLDLLRKENRLNDFKIELDKSFNSLVNEGENARLKIYNIDVKISPYFGEKLTTVFFKETDFYKGLSL